MCSAGKVEAETESREGRVDLVAPVRPLYHVEPTQSGEAVLPKDVWIVSSSNAIGGWDLSMSKKAAVVVVENQPSCSVMRGICELSWVSSKVFRKGKSRSLIKMEQGRVMRSDRLG